MGERRDRRILTWILAGTLILVCGYSLCYNVIGVTMDPLIEEFQLTGAAQGLMSSMISLGSMLSLLLLPLLQGRVHKMWLILFRSILQLLMLLLTGAASGFTMLLTACVLLGAGNNFTDSCVNNYVVDLYGDDSGRSLSLIHGFYGIGGLITPVLITAILARGGWRSAYFAAAGVFAAICVVFAAVCLPRFRKVDTAAAAVEQKITREMFASYLREPRNLFILGAAAFSAAAQVGLINWVVRYESVRYNSAEIGSMCMFAYWVTCAGCRVFASSLRISPNKILIGGATAAGVAHALGILCGGTWGMLVASGFVGLLSGLCIPMLVGEAARGNADKTALTTSAVFLIMGLARMVMPLVMGAVGGASLVAAMLLPAAAHVLVAVCTALGNKRLPRA